MKNFGAYMGKGLNGGVLEVQKILWGNKCAGVEKFRGIYTTFLHVVVQCGAYVYGQGISLD